MSAHLSRFSKHLIRSIWKNYLIFTDKRPFNGIRNYCETKHSSSDSVIVRSDGYHNRSTNFQYDHGLGDCLKDIEKLARSLKMRHIDCDLNQLKIDYKRFCELEKQKMDMEEKRTRIAKEVSQIHKRKAYNSNFQKKGDAELLEKWKEDGKVVKMALKELLSEFRELEEKVMLTASSLPVDLLESVTEHDEIIAEYCQDNKLMSQIDHMEVLEHSASVKLSNVGKKTYYLTGRLAILEQELIHRFCSELHSRGITLMLAPEIFKTPVLEAANMNVVDPKSAYRLQVKQGTNSVTDWNHDNLYLTGVSQLSFLAYFAKHIINDEDMPIKMFAVGRNYLPENTTANHLPGLLGALQTIKVCAFGLSSSDGSNVTLMDDMKSMLVDIYQGIGLPFRLVSKSAKSLTKLEQNRIEVQIWVPSLQDYLNIASVSACGDYSSRRLMIRCGSASDNSLIKPAFMVHSEVTDVTRMLSLLLEYGLTHKHWDAQSNGR